MGCPHCGAMTVQTMNDKGEILSGTVTHKPDCSWIQGWRIAIKERNKQKQEDCWEYDGKASQRWRA